MYRIRFHGRGGEGMKTASRITGTAFFLQGYEVQDAPRYGAERRGAPVFAYVRASAKIINERGIIRRPDLVVVADESLFTVASSAIIEGVGPQSVILVNSASVPDQSPDMTVKFKIITIPGPPAGHADATSTVCAAAAARLTGIISRKNFEQAVREELAPLSREAVEDNVLAGLSVFDTMGRYAGQVQESADIPEEKLKTASWTELPLHSAWRSAPAIRRPQTGRLNLTGSWRTHRPEIDPEACSRCLLCALYCPDSVISTALDGMPTINYDHCKGCMICESVCPAHAIGRITEHRGREQKP